MGSDYKLFVSQSRHAAAAGQPLSFPFRPRPDVSIRVQEQCESRGGRLGAVLMSLTVSVDVKQHRLNRASALVTISVSL